ncbi:MAG: 6-carboxytetrahydropterin synthase QueD [Lachnospiraceae bacterium]|nr:6-carboxytetrahydropterin synthase QueD [Lachnospiraceae bacterium]
MYCLKTSASFDSAHFLSGYNGKCANIHGHTWRIEVVICGDTLQENGEKQGMLIDFSDLKRIVKSVADIYDHTLIYEENTLKESTVNALIDEGFELTKVSFRPTAENFAYHFYEMLVKQGLNIKSVTVYETPENCAVYEV